MARKLRQINKSLNGYEPEGRELESRRARHIPQTVASQSSLKSGETAGNISALSSNPDKLFLPLLF
jgi:hypothetical protein